MHNVAKALLVGGGAAAVIGYSGFPSRVGLTKSQSSVSMPGDLLIPTADHQADRAASVYGTPEQLWPVVHELKTLYEDVLDVPLLQVYEDQPELMVWQVAKKLRDGRRDEDLLQTTVAVTLHSESPETTSIHIRERYQTFSGGRGRFAALAQMTVSAVAVRGLLSKLRREANGLRKKGR